jgi:hypothetical protein
LLEKMKLANKEMASAAPKRFPLDQKNEPKKVSQSGGLLQVPLLSLAKAGLPLIINFGSCT